MYSALEDVVLRVPHDQRLVLCGDFNARTGSLMHHSTSPTLGSCTSVDSVICARGRWLA